MLVPALVVQDQGRDLIGESFVAMAASQKSAVDGLLQRLATPGTGLGVSDSFGWALGDGAQEIAEVDTGDKQPLARRSALPAVVAGNMNGIAASRHIRFGSPHPT